MTTFILPLLVFSGMLAALWAFERRQRGRRMIPILAATAKPARATEAAL